MEHTVKFIAMSAGLLLTGLFISLSVALYRESDGIANNAAGDTQKDVITLSELEYTMIQTQALSGANVKTFIHQYRDKLLIQVVTKRIATGYYVFDEMNVQTSKYYINDKTTFSGKVIRDEDDDIVALSFTEVGMLAQEVDLNYEAPEKSEQYIPMAEEYFTNLESAKEALATAESLHKAAEVNYNSAQQILRLKKAELDALPIGDLTTQIDEMRQKISKKSSDLEILKRIMDERGIVY